MSRRVMNLAHFLTQNARRHGERIGFIWGDRSWTWREIDAAGLGAGGGTRRARHRQGRPHSRAFQELRRDVLVDVRSLSSRRGLGADQFPADAGRGGLSRHGLRRQGVPVPRRFSRSCRRRQSGEPGARFHLADRRGHARRDVVARSDLGPCRRHDRQRGGRVRRLPAGSSSPPAPRGVPRRRC